ncbi:hypothetical protein FJ936_09355 [Mesorhizobium sp. B2-4-13]|nr:hypothetical protein FJ936_09355 [Mesorhizobium sp. B2-4-13]
MTTAAPLARYGAVEGALASGFATAELHHLWGRDQIRRGSFGGLSGSPDHTRRYEGYGLANHPLSH